MKKYFLFLVCLLSVSAQSQSVSEIYNAGIKAYEARDYPTFLRLSQQLDSIRPLHPTFTYNLAAAYALNGQSDPALKVLRKIVLMNHTVAFENDNDFATLKTVPAYQKILELKAHQHQTVITSKKEVTLSEKTLHPEGLAYLSQTKTWLASSIHHRKIVTFDPKTGVCKDWLKAKTMLAVFAMKADAKEEFLWVATSALPEMNDYNPSLEGKAEILKVSLQSRAIVQRYSVPGHHVFGDLVVAKNGTVYVSDSLYPMVYAITAAGISPCVSFENEGFNLQGMALNAAEDKLFVADYLKGIAVVNLTANHKVWLDFPEEISAKGIDGLVFQDNTVTVIQNGVNPIRIVQLQLNPAQNKIEHFSIIDHNRPEFNEPTLPVLVGNRIYFVANAPWKAYDKNGNLQETKVTNPEIYSVAP